jgi:hypothetical protein
MIAGLAVFIAVCLSGIIALAACVAAGDADRQAGIK